MQVYFVAFALPPRFSGHPVPPLLGDRMGLGSLRVPTDTPARVSEAAIMPYKIKTRGARKVHQLLSMNIVLGLARIGDLEALSGQQGRSQ